MVAERGHRFRGRQTALTEIVTWLDRPELDRKVLVVTGSPGVGKSAVLGRIVTTADVEMRAALPPDDDTPRASAGSVACAVHAKGKTALDVAMEIARAASAPIPERLKDLPAGLREVLTERGGRRFNVVVDALDEASDPAQARAIITAIVLPTAQTCVDVGAQVVVGRGAATMPETSCESSDQPEPPSTWMTPDTSPSRTSPPTVEPAGHVNRPRIAT